MFSGIVEGHRPVVAIDAAPRKSARGDDVHRLSIAMGELAEDAVLGASIAINGVCLTVMDRAGDVLSFEAVPETMRLTNLGRLRVGDAVNVERSMRAGARVDGHFVQGHVDGVATVVEIDRGDGGYKLWLRPPPELMRYMVRKGSIALDGVSLTLVDADAARGLCSVVLIPTTLSWTNLGQRAVGDWINVESDVFARLVVTRLDALFDELVANGRDPREAIALASARSDR